MPMLTYMHPEAVKKFLQVNGLKNVRADLPFLAKLGEAFQKIPYENLTKIIRAHTFKIDLPLTPHPLPASRQVSPNGGGGLSRLRLPELLYEEHLKFGTGGTCFSMTYFLQTLLRSCGFKTYPIMADRPLAPDTHCLSVIVLENKKYILDPGFMIDRPLPLSKMPEEHHLKHNNILVGAKGAIKIPPQQMRYFEGFEKKGKDERGILRSLRSLRMTTNLSELDSRFSAGGGPTSGWRGNDNYSGNDNDIGNDMAPAYTLATVARGKITVRYFMKDEPVEGEEFLKFWQASFDWPTLRNISITTATSTGYIYARNNFLRTTTSEGRKQERVKKELGTVFAKTFGIDAHIVDEAFEMLKCNDFRSP